MKTQEFEKKPFDYYWDQIKNEFNFVKVHKAMVATEWKWVHGNFKSDVPSVERISTVAYELLKEAHETGRTIATGGFMAGWYDDEMFLIFTLHEKSCS